MMMQMDPEESIQTKFMKEAAEEPEKVEIEAKEFDESHRFAMYDDNNPVSCIDPDEVIHIDLESDLSIVTWICIILKVRSEGILARVLVMRRALKSRCHLTDAV